MLLPRLLPITGGEGMTGLCLEEPLWTSHAPTDKSLQREGEKTRQRLIKGQK